MADKLIYIPNDDTQIAPSVDYNQRIKRLNIELNEPTNKIPKVARPTIMKTVL